MLYTVMLYISIYFKTPCNNGFQISIVRVTVGIHTVHCSFEQVHEKRKSFWHEESYVRQREIVLLLNEEGEQNRAVHAFQKTWHDSKLLWIIGNNTFTRIGTHTSKKLQL